jgi:pseudomonalisin
MFHPRDIGSTHRGMRATALLAGLLSWSAAPAPAAPQPVLDDGDRIVLTGNVHPLARPEHDFGKSDASLPMEQITLVLDMEPDKEAALKRLLAAQLDPASGKFHHWLSPEEFGNRFGRSAEDIGVVVGWLRAHGFTIDEVPPSRTWINFSGTAGNVDGAFQTEIHDYLVDDVLHHANATEPSLPRALASIVKGLATLHDFVAPTAYHRSTRNAQVDVAVNGANYLGPADFAKIYDLPAAYTGAGQTIAIVARSNILLSDAEQFRSSFGLPPRDPQIIVNGPDPGSLKYNEETEADLDTEWSGAVAPDATIALVVSATTNTTDGAFLSAQYIVSHNLAPIMSLSFSPCEQLMSPAYQTAVKTLWAQAAAQGITVVASSGDWGAAGCSYYQPANPADNPYAHDQAVSGFCSTPSNVCVGGTQFDEGGHPSLYWTAQGAALGYIPEDAWNETLLGATGGGPSNVYLDKPTWQSGRGDGRRDVPDVSLSAALHDGYEYVQEFALRQVGGTSASAPAFAGLMARVVQKTGQRQGNPNPVLYQLATAQSQGLVGQVFHDVLVGDNSFAGIAGFQSATGYDLATGLGSVDVAALIAAWPLLGAQLAASPPSGVTPLLTSLTAEATGEGYGTVNYTFWWNCPYSVSTVPQATQQCGDPTDPTVGAKFDSVSGLAQSVPRTYANPGTYTALVIVERNNGSVAATAAVAVAPASTCTSFAITPASASPAASAGLQQVAVVGSPAGCQGGGWTAAGNGSWLAASPASGSGSGTVAVSWTANGAPAARSGAATIAGASFPVTQVGTTSTAPPAPYLLSPGASVIPGTTTNLLSPSFFWLAVAGADSYQLELSDSSTVYPDQTISAPQTSVVLPNPLADNHAYTWRMRSHGAAGWGPFGGYYYFSTYTGLTTGDFSISASPSSVTVSPGAAAAFIVDTATVQGSPQTLTFSVGTLPAGVSSSFSPGSAPSGGQATLTLGVGSGTAPGSYVVSITVTSNLGVAHSTTVGLTVSSLSPGGQPAVCLTPPSLGFSDQMVGTASATQLVTLRNCGNAPLHVSSLGASPDFFIGAGSIVPPFDLIAAGSTTFSAGFAPLASGPRTGMVKIFTNAPGSPATLPLSGTATPAPTTTGTINVAATLNGQPFSGYMVFSLTGPGGTIIFGNVPFSDPDQGAGSYSVALSGSAPGGGSLASITPAATQTLQAGGAVLFTFNFTAVNDFNFTCPTATFTGTTPLMVTTPGGSASVPLSIGYIVGGSQTVNLGVAGVPAASTGAFNPQSVVLNLANASSTFTITTGAATAPGVYQLTFTATNQDGTTRSLTGTLAVVTNNNPSLLSAGMGAAPADGLSDLPAISADGRYIAFLSTATNLVPGDTNADVDVFVRDQQTGATARVSVAEDGSQADDGSSLPAISADGRFAVFQSSASNLVPGGRRGLGDVYVRDLQLGHNTWVNLSSSGVPSDGGAREPSISGNGRYVVFDSNSTNLVPGGGGGVQQVYVRDLQNGTTSLVSAATDGSPGDGDSTRPIISGDGRYVAFVSAADNFVPGATASGRQVFLRDLTAQTTELVSGPPSGGAPNAQVASDSDERIAVSPDGRYVAFTSYASNLVPGDGNFNSDVFLWDRITKALTAVSVANDGTLLAGGGAPAISADGRFVAFRLYIAGAPGQTAVRDTVTGQTVLHSVGPANAPGSSPSAATALSADGRVVAFSSFAPNLVAGDTNGQEDVFAVVLPVAGAAFARTLAVSPASVPGGTTATGTVTLSAPAPAEGASVRLASSAPGAAVPALVFVPAGSSAVSFPIPTLPVVAEVPVSLTASYGGGSPWTLLLLEPAGPARINVLAGDGQTAAVSSTLPVALSARVLDSANNPAANVPVQFSAPATGPSGTFSGGSTSVLVSTDASGVATAPAFTANNLSGSYAVVAYAAGVSAPAVFNVANRSGYFYTLLPCRIIDTRNPPGSLAGPALQPGSLRTFAVIGACGVPPTAAAISVNVTITGPTAGGYLTLAPGGQALPLTSTINFRAGQTRANNAVLGLARDASGTFVVLDGSAGTVNFILDVNGYFQ